MKIEYLGTGAAEGVPAVFCNCEYCRAARKHGGRELRSRAQVLLDKELSIDFPPDLFAHAAYLGADLSAVKYLLVTHSHMDHFCAHDLVLRGYKYAHAMTSPTLDIYGNEEICAIYTECTRREMKEAVEENIRTHAVSAFEEFSCGDWHVHTLAARHSSRDPLLFLIEKGGKRVLHLCDTGLLPDDDYEYLRCVGGGPVQLIDFDCTFLYEPHAEESRHMGLEDNMRVLARLEEIGLADRHTKKVITHFSHNSVPSPSALRKAERQYGVIAAYDGMELDI